MPDAADLALAREAGIPDSLVAALSAAGGDMRRLIGFDSMHVPMPARGLTIAVPEDRVYPTIERLRSRFDGEFVVFRSEMNFGQGPDRVAVLRSRDWRDALRVMGTNGVNLDVSPDSILRQLDRWDARFGLRLLGAGFDWVDFELLRPPRDMHALAREIDAFCPDVVDQGTETVGALAEEMRRTRTLYCWWG